MSLPMGGDEVWRVIRLDDDFSLISRNGTPLSATQRAAVLAALNENKDQTYAHDSQKH